MLNPASGIGIYASGSKLAIRLLRQGCTNRPFYHVVVAEVRKSTNSNFSVFTFILSVKER